MREANPDITDLRQDFAVGRAFHVRRLNRWPAPQGTLLLGSPEEVIERLL